MKTKVKSTINKLKNQKLPKEKMKKVKGGDDVQKVKFFNQMKKQVREWEQK